VPRELRERIRDRKPRRFEFNEDVALRAESGIVIERARRNPDFLLRIIRDRTTAHIAKRSRITRRSLPHRRNVSSDERFTGKPPKLRALADEPCGERRSTRFSASRAVIQSEAQRAPAYLVLNATAETASA